MGVLTSNPYENAWIIIGLIAASAVALLIVLGVPGWYMGTRYTADEIIASVFSTITLLSAALLPLGIFSSGIIVDFINQSYNYSKASIVGFIGVLLTKIFGSSTFADLSKSAIGFLPAVKTVDGNWSILGVSVWGLIVAVLGTTVGTSFGVGGGNIGKGITLGVVVPLILVILAGLGFLGRFTETGPTYGPEMGGPVTLGEAERWFTGGGFKLDDPVGYCDVPGFEWAKNFVAPPSVVLSQTVIWYHLIEDWDTKNASSSILIGTSSLVILMLQWLTLQRKGCLNPYRAGLFAPLVAMVVSITIAGSAYGIIKNLPVETDASSPPTVKPKPLGPGGKPVCPPGYSPDAANDTCVKKVGPGGTRFELPILVGGQQETSAPVDDQDAFVCEAYKDGELITSTIVD